jgi:predicted nucleotidyltransferase
MDNNKKLVDELFFKPTYKFHIRELARQAKINPNTVINIIKKLEKDEIVSVRKLKHIVEISLNLENKKTLWKKRIFNLSRIYESGIIDFLVSELSPKSLSLIGSYSRGEDIESSDIDIVSISSSKKILDLSNFEKILKRKIHLLNIEQGKMSKEFLNNLINGIVLYGAIET